VSKLLFIFLDGVGIGEQSDSNPFYYLRPEYLPFFIGGTLPDKTPVKPIDANLCTTGTPQSATGQSSLFTGFNLPRILGRHTGSFPNKTMRKYLYKHNLLKKIRESRTNSFFINAYPFHADFFTSPHLELEENGNLFFSDRFPEKFKRRISVSTCLLLSCGQRPFDETNLKYKTAVFQDYSNTYLKNQGMNIKIFSPQDAAQILVERMKKDDFILYEYFQTDLYAHRKTLQEKQQLIFNLNLMIEYLISKLNPADTTLLITSDHGNLEDVSNRSHSRNPVPLLTWGEKGDALRKNINSIIDVTPVILNIFN
jgi:hypothetical protein